MGEDKNKSFGLFLAELDMLTGGNASASLDKILSSGCPCNGCVWDTLDRDGKYAQCCNCNREGRKGGSK